MLSFLGSFYSVLLNRLKLQRHKRRAQYKPQKRDIIVSGKKKTFIIQKNSPSCTGTSNHPIRQTPDSPPKIGIGYRTANNKKNKNIFMKSHRNSKK